MLAYDFQNFKYYSLALELHIQIDIIINYRKNIMMTWK